MLRDKAALHDIRQAAEEIMNSMQEVSFDEFAVNREKQAAILYFFIVIGEATKRLSAEFRDTYPQIDWNGMAGMRDILAHQYDRVNVQVIWDAVQTDLPELLVQIKSLIEELL
jgi:uncharacterized protein with HEPN domain